jgi:hypothetical protein
MSPNALLHDPGPPAPAVAQPHARSTRRAPLRLSEGVRAGLIGATAIWLWLLAVDAIAGRPLHTPGTIGRGLLGIILPGAHTALWADVLAFTLVHYALWALFGTLIVRAVVVDVRPPGVLLWAITILVLLQLVFLGITEILAQTALQRYAWPAIFGGNLVGWLVAGSYLLRRHPELPAEFRRDGEG